MPMIMVTIYDKETGDCKWNWPEQWMGAANETTWLVLLACIPLTIMTGLYSRVVYTLWFKRNDDHELAYRQKVGANYLVHVLLSSEQNVNFSITSFFYIPRAN